MKGVGKKGIAVFPNQISMVINRSDEISLK